MRTVLLLTALLVSASCGHETASSGAQPVVVTDPGTGGGDPPVDEPTGRVRSVADVLSVLERGARPVDQVDATSTTSNAIRYRARFVDGYPGLLEFVLNNTGSGWQEKFLLQLPPTPPVAPVPLLAVFHKFGSSHGDVLNTTFLAEVQARGWYCIAPLGARQKHFGNNESQINTRAALELVAQLFPVDRNRVYGVGFSMGGGALANYAARHLDPNGVQFAAICEHTGGVSLAHTWFYEPDDADLDDDWPTPGANLEPPDILEDLFGGTPAQVPFAYQRCSTVDVDVFTGQVGVGTDFARNLSHVPTLVWMANYDPLIYLGTQTNAFYGHIQPQNPAHQLTVVSGTSHSWSTLDETVVCDWLQQFTLQSPMSGSMLCDEDGVWRHFVVEQVAHTAFTPITWAINVALRRVDVLQTANLLRVSVDAARHNLVGPGLLTLRLTTADGTGDRVRVTGLANPPSAVRRDGVLTSGAWNGATQSFEITETDGALHVWTLTFP